MPNGRIGAEGDAPTNCAFIFVFKLPELPAKQTIQTADLRINLESLANPDDPDAFVHNADLYGVRQNSRDAVVASDYFLGTFGSDTNSTAIQKDILTPKTPIGVVHTDPTGGNNLVSWLMGQYKAGGAGQYVFLRLNANAQSVRSRYYVVSSADNPTAENRPLLMISTK